MNFYEFKLLSMNYFQFPQNALAITQRDLKNVSDLWLIKILYHQK